MVICDYDGVPKLVQRIAFNRPKQMWHVLAFDGRWFEYAKDTVPVCGGCVSWYPTPYEYLAATNWFESNPKLWFPTKRRYIMRGGVWITKKSS